MQKITNKGKSSKKKNDLKVTVRFSDEPCTEEESIKAMTDVCLLLLEMDRDHHRKKLAEGVQCCDYCGKQITELYDFCSPDGRNCCMDCGKKLLEDPNRQKTFCGIPVRKD